MHRSTVSTSTLRPLTLAVQMALMGTAFADTALPGGDAQPEVTTLEAVTVTATSTHDATEGTRSYTAPAEKTATPLELSPRETPQSVSVVTRQRIEDQDMQTVMDVVNNATGVSVNRYETNRAQFNARGFKINSLMIDSVPTIWEQPWSSGEVFSSLIMYDRVELVRGANGLMTGAGDPSASINLVHKRANSRQLTGSVGLSAGSWHQVGVQADVSTALNESGTVRGRLVGEFTDGDSWIDLLSNKRQTVYGTLDIDLSANTVLWLGISHQENDTDSPMWGGLPVWYSDGTLAHWSRSKTTSADWSRWDSTYDNYFVNLEHSFANGWHGKISYSRGEREADSYLLYLSGNPNPGMSSFPGSYNTKTTQDDVSLQASGPFRLLGRQHELAFGYVHSRQRFDAMSRPAQTGFGGIADFDSYDGSFPEPVWGALSFYEESETTQQGLYGMARINLADPLKLILGTRVSRYEKTGHGLYSEAYDIDHDNEVTPYAGVVYDINETLSAYVSYTNIFLPQSERDINGKYLDPVLGKSTEAGIKGEFMEGRLNASAAIFRIRQDNLARSTGDMIPGTTELAYVTSEGATSKGVELELSGELAANWNASLGYTQFQATDAGGDKVNTLYPRKLLRTFTAYRLPGQWDNVTLGGGVNWQSEIYTNATNPAGNSERITQKAYALVNLMARYEVSPQLSLQLNADNLFDEEYFDVFNAYGAITYGAPRSVTASARYKF